MDVRVTPATVTVEAIRQSVLFVDQKQKLQLLTHWLRKTPWTRTLVFTRTKHGADKVAKSLMKAGIQADAFHSNKSQSARQRVLLRFKAPQPLVLVATDIAARGLDIDDVSHVVNFDLPIDADNYIHRIGRTGRAGAAGVAVSFCDHGERSTLQAIQRLTRQTLEVEECPVGMIAQSGKVSSSDTPIPRVGRSQGRTAARTTVETGKHPLYRAAGRKNLAAYGAGRVGWRRDTAGRGRAAKIREPRLRPVQSWFRGHPKAPSLPC